MIARISSRHAKQPVGTRFSQSSANLVAGHVREPGMTIIPRKKIVVLGMMSRIPVAGEMWLTIQYLIGFQRLGYEVYYVESHGIQPAGMLEGKPDEDSSARAAAFISRVMTRFDLGGQWAFQALHADGRFYGMTENQVKA